MQEGLNPKIINLAIDPKYGKFSLEPLPRGFGHTLGSALRRVIMSQLEGAAITDVRFQGALHEFSALPGVAEDTTEILLNIKEIAVKLQPSSVDTEEEEYVMHLHKTGVGEVTAGDITYPPGITILNPELHIARITDAETEIDIELWVESGTGYLPVEHHDRHRKGPGIIPLDAVFSPIHRAAYFVEATRLGHRTDLERLIIEVWGDGTIAPDAAVRKAADTIINHLVVFSTMTAEQLVPEAAETGVVEERDKALDVPIEDVDFSVRTFNCLKKEGINTIGRLISKTEEELLDIRNFGHRSLEEVLEKLASFGLSLAKPGGGEEH